MAPSGDLNWNFCPSGPVHSPSMPAAFIVRIRSSMGPRNFISPPVELSGAITPYRARYHSLPERGARSARRVDNRLLSRCVQLEGEDSGVGLEIGVGGEDGPVASDGDGANEDVGDGYG